MSKKYNARRFPRRRDILKYGLYGSLGASVSNCIWVSGCSKKQGVKKPGIILITIDTLRADHLSCYGYPQETTPNIDRFAQESLLFENCFSHAPITSSSLASVMSGFLPHETKVFRNLPLPDAVETLPKILKRQGYKTVAVVSNFMLRKKTGWARGYVKYDDDLSDQEQVRKMPERIAQHTTDRSLELLKQFHKDSLFMWIHYQDPHGPYTPPEDYVQKFRNPDQEPRLVQFNEDSSGLGGIPLYQQIGSNRDYYDYVCRYDGEIYYLDEHFQRLIEGLKELGFYDEALIILTADHGEGMGENDYYFAHGDNLHGSLLHVPLMIKHGKSLVGRIASHVQHIDIAPTVLNFIGLEADKRYRGSNLLKAPPAHREIFAEMRMKEESDIRFCLMTDDYKLIFAPLNDQYQLYDMSTDPLEEHNLIDNADYGQRTKVMQANLSRIRREDLLDLSIVNRELELTEEEKEKLRSLGYIR